MRPRLGVACVGWALACGSDPGPTASAPSDGSSSDDGPAPTSTHGPDDASEDDGGTDTWDQSQCSDKLTGAVEWSATIFSDAERGAGLAIARAPDFDVYVLDGCLSRWTEQGVRAWQISDPATECRAMVLDLDDLPVVIGERSTKDGTVAFVEAYDAEGELRWSTELPAVLDRVRITADLAIDGHGTLVVASRIVPPEGPSHTTITALEPTGQVRWNVPLEPGVQGPPQVGVDYDGHIVVAEPRRSEQGVELVRLTTLEPDGTERSRWNSIDELGYPLRLGAMAVDPRGYRLLAGRDPSQQGEPHLLTLLPPDGPRVWVRSSLDLAWLETIAAVAFDPCGSLVIAGAGDSDADVWGQLWIAKLDRQGELRWGRYEPAPFFHRDTMVAGLAMEADGGVLATGKQVVGQDQQDGATVPLFVTWVARAVP